MNHLLKLQKDLREKTLRLQELMDVENRDDSQTQEMRGLISELPQIKSEIVETQAAQGVIDWQKQINGNLPEVGRKGEAIMVVDPETGQRKMVEDNDPSPLSLRQQKAIAETSYKNDWLYGVTKGFNNLPNSVYKALQEGLDDYGGYLVPADISDRIIARKAHPTSILGKVTRIQTGRDRLFIPRFLYTTDDIRESGIAAQWTGETGTTAEDTSLQSWGSKEIPVHELTFDIQLSRSLREDAMFDFEGWIARQASSAYALTLDQVVVSTTGNGNGKPTGMLFNAGGTQGIPTQNVGNPVGGDGIFDLIGALPAQYRDGASFLSNSSTVWADLAQIKAGSNEYIGLVQSWNSNVLGAPRVDKIAGYDLSYSAYMPAAAGAAKILIFGDFAEAYTLVERVGLAAYPYGDQDRAMLTTGLVGIVFRARVGGDVTQDRAAVIGVQS